MAMNANVLLLINEVTMYNLYNNGVLENFVISLRYSILAFYTVQILSILVLLLKLKIGISIILQKH